MTLARGAGLLSLLILGSLLVAGLLDWNLHLASTVRALLLVSILGGVAVVAWRWLIAPLRQRTDDLSLALQVEAQYPVLNDALASTVQFLQQPEDSPTAGAPVLRREAVQRALRLAQGCDFNKVVDTRGLRVTGLAAGVAAFLAVLVVVLVPTVTRPALLRLLDPFGGHDWESETQLELAFRKKIANSRPFEIHAAVTGKVPATALVEFQGLNRREQSREYEIKPSADGKSGTFVVKVDMTGQSGSFKFRVQANDAREPKREGRWHTVEVLEPPQLIGLNNQPPPQITLDVPAYTDLPSPQQVPPGTWEIDVIEGTWAHLHAATNRPITRAWIELRPADAKQVLAARLAPIGHANSLAALSVHAGTGIGLQRIPGTIDDAGCKLAFTFRPWLNGNYFLHIEDSEELDSEYPLTIKLSADPVPVVYLNRLVVDLGIRDNASEISSGAPAAVYLSPKAVVRLQLVAEDETFALSDVDLVFGRQNPFGGMLWPQRISLYDHKTAGESLALLLAGLADGPQTPPGALLAALAERKAGRPARSLRLRPKHLELERRWSLDGLVKVGDVLIAEVWAYDFNNVTGIRTPGKSRPVELHIVSDKEFNHILEERQGKIYKKLLALAEEQGQAQKKVIQAKAQLDATGKLREEDEKLLVEASEQQKQIQDEVDGTPNQPGLRQDLEQLLDMIKDNQIESSGAKDRIKMLKKELDALSDKHLQPIQNKLRDPKSKDNLAQAAKHQKQTADGLAELIAQLNRWASVQEIKEEVQAILREQQELKTDTEKLNQTYNPDDNQWKASVQRVAELQRRLGDKAQKLLDKMDGAASKKEKDDPALAELLREAARIGKEMKLPAEIQDTGKQLRMVLMSLPDNMRKTLGHLREKQPNRAIGQQEESIKTLKEMYAALDEKREDELERLVKNQKKTRGEVDEVLEKLEKLQKKVEAAAKIADPQQRKQALQQLADEQRKLEDEARKKGRELAQLRADDANEDLKQAADAMKQAAKQLDAGDDPGENQKKAQEDLKKARDKLEKAQNEAQDELAREKLARIADQLKGLKDRQDAALAETERLHREALKGGWRRDLVISLLGHESVEKGLAKETAALAKKLEGAKVYEMILSKASKDMDSAGEAILMRRTAANNRQGKFPLDPEEIQEENQQQEQTVKLQKRAADRLQRLLDALKSELDRPKLEQQDQDGGGGDGAGGGQQQGGIQAQDGIPAVAQLKALRAEQWDVNERTQAFNKAHPLGEVLRPEAQAELEGLHADQQAIFRLFQEMATAANKGERK
jgi:hypothetical protein